MSVDIVIHKTEPVQETIFLNARKSLNGNIMIFDHNDVDVVIIPENKKLLVLAKDQFSDKVYEVQDRLFSYLTKNGILELGSIQSGNVYGSLEAKLITSLNEEVSLVEVAMFNIWNVLKEEKAYLEKYGDNEDEEMDYLTNPDAEHSTELGEVPHEDKKGSLVPGYVRGPYGMTTFYRY